MYYIFQTRMVQWQGINLNAELQSKLSSEWHAKYDWWESKSLKGLLPSLTFAIYTSNYFVDNYFTGNQFDLYSERLISILDKTGVRYETFPVTLIDQGTGKTIEHSYKLFHLLEIDPAVDMEKSMIEEVTVGTRKVPEIHQLVLSEDFVKQGKAITRIKEFRNLTVIRNDIKESLESANITGCSFIAVEEFSVGMTNFLRNLRSRISEKT